jgi:hypothetical protein
VGEFAVQPPQLGTDRLGEQVRVAVLTRRELDDDPQLAVPIGVFQRFQHELAGEPVADLRLLKSDCHVFGVDVRAEEGHGEQRTPEDEHEWQVGGGTRFGDRVEPVASAEVQHFPR